MHVNHVSVSNGFGYHNDDQQSNVTNTCTIMVSKMLITGTTVVLTPYAGDKVSKCWTFNNNNNINNNRRFV